MPRRRTAPKGTPSASAPTTAAAAGARARKRQAPESTPQQQQRNARPAARRDGGDHRAADVPEGTGWYRNGVTNSAASPPKVAKKRGNSEAGHAARWSGASDTEIELQPGWKRREEGTGKSKRVKYTSPGGDSQYGKGPGEKEMEHRRSEGDPRNTAVRTGLALGKAAEIYGDKLDRRAERGPVTGPGTTGPYKTTPGPVTAAPVPPGLMVAATESVDRLVHGINQRRACRGTVGGRKCTGNLVPTATLCAQLGGAVKIWYECDGNCGSSPVQFDGTGGPVTLGEVPPDVSVIDGALVLQTPQPDSAAATYLSRVGLSYALSFLLSGKHYADYNKQCRGADIPCAYNKQTYSELVHVVLPFTRTVLKQDIHAAQHWHEQNGSWKNLKTAADGVWQTRSFSKNHTFIVNDIDLDGALLAWCHACMRGKCDGDTEIKWGGTSKAMEGHCASVCYNEIKSRGGAVEKNWLDGDASSEKEVTAVFPEAICMRCYGHKCRATGKSLDKAGKKQGPTTADVSRHASLAGKTCQ